MKLFENEVIDISRIGSIRKFLILEDAVRTGKIYTFASRLSTYELAFFVEGENNTQFGDQSFHDCDLAMRYMPKGQNNVYRVQSLRHGYGIVVSFDTDSPMPERASFYPDMGCLKDSFLRLNQIWTYKKPGYYVNAMAEFYNLIRTFRNYRSRYLSGSQQNRMEDAYAYILENYLAADFDYRALCQTSGLSYSYFSELFQAKYHMSPRQMVTKLKLDEAQELLSDGRYSVTEIAEMCGFENVYYFSNVFKKHLGIPPSRFTEQWR